jgi:hypothetical protein
MHSAQPAKSIKFRSTVALHIKMKTVRAPDRRGNGKAEGRLAVFVEPLLGLPLGSMDLDLDLNASPTLAGFPADPLPIEKESSVKPMEEKTPAGQPIVDREKVRQTRSRYY